MLCTGSPSALLLDAAMFGQAVVVDELRIRKHNFVGRCGAEHVSEVCQVDVSRFFADRFREG